MEDRQRVAHPIFESIIDKTAVETVNPKRGIQLGSQADKLLQALKKGPRTNSYFILAMSQPNFRSRLSDLRAAGHIIDHQSLGAGVWEYYYMGRNQKTL